MLTFIVVSLDSGEAWEQQAQETATAGDCELGGLRSGVLCVFQVWPFEPLKMA